MTASRHDDEPVSLWALFVDADFLELRELDVILARVDGVRIGRDGLPVLGGYSGLIANFTVELRIENNLPLIQDPIAD